MGNQKFKSTAEYIKYLADNHIKLELPEDNSKYPMQSCQDDEITKSFRGLHVDIVNMIISWCKEHNVMIDEFHLNADGVRYSIPHGEWTSSTDSALTFYDDNNTDKAVLLSM